MQPSVTFFDGASAPSSLEGTNWGATPAAMMPAMPDFKNERREEDDEFMKG
jgi:hypothetical protein